MNDKFDELAKSVTRRGALKKFGVGLVGTVLACLRLADKAMAGKPCTTDADCPGHHYCALVLSNGSYIQICLPVKKGGPY